MKYGIIAIAVGLLYVLAYGLVSKLSPEASYAIIGGMLVLFGVLVMGIIGIFLVAVMRPRESKREDRGYAPQPPVIMLAGNGQMDGAHMQQALPPPMPQLYLPKRSEVEHDEW